jgi:hypothetical protein
LALQENLNSIRTGDIHSQAMLGEEDSLGQEAAEKVVEDLKFESALLNAALKNLNKNWDFYYHPPIAFWSGWFRDLRLPSFRHLHDIRQRPEVARTWAEPQTYSISPPAVESSTLFKPNKRAIVQ